MVEEERELCGVWVECRWTCTEVRSSGSSRWYKEGKIKPPANSQSPVLDCGQQNGQLLVSNYCNVCACDVESW